VKWFGESSTSVGAHLCVRPKDDHVLSWISRPHWARRTGEGVEVVGLVRIVGLIADSIFYRTFSDVRRDSRSTNRWIV